MFAGRGGGGRSILTSRGQGDAPPPLSRSCAGLGNRPRGREGLAGGTQAHSSGAAALRLPRVTRARVGWGGRRRSEAGKRERARWAVRVGGVPVTGLTLGRGEGARGQPTGKDLDECYDKGHKDGFKIGTDKTLRTVYAGVVLQLLDEGNTEDEAISFLRSLDERLIRSIDAGEDIEEVFQRTGVRLMLKEDFDRIEVV